MKRLAAFLVIVLLVVTLLLTGCGTDKQAASGLPKDSVNTVSNNTSQGSENKSNLKDGEKSQAEQSSSAAKSKPTDNVQGQGTSSPSTATVTTGIKANSSPPTSTTTPTTQAPIPLQPENTDKPAVMITINCSTAVAKGLDKQENFKDVVPMNGIILPPTNVEFQEGETVFDVLKLVTHAKNIQLQYGGSAGTVYIKGINNLYELDGGPLSGWMYAVNKVYANYGCGQTKLKKGDSIEWNYTCNMGKDLGQK